jgi:pimeloyl-ACP methyl ester carboxylesterase
MSAACEFGEQTFVDAGYSVLVASRPGYGRTLAGSGPSAPEFVSRLARLCRRLGFAQVSVVGISLGARSAMTLAAYYPTLVERVVLMCPTSFKPWPDPRTRLLAKAVFNPATQHATWGVVHRLLRTDRTRFLPGVLGNLTSLEPHEAVRRLDADRDRVVEFLLS